MFKANKNIDVFLMFLQLSFNISYRFLLFQTFNKDVSWVELIEIPLMSLVNLLKCLSGCISFILYSRQVRQIRTENCEAMTEYAAKQNLIFMEEIDTQLCSNLKKIRALFSVKTCTQLESLVCRGLFRTLSVYL